MTSLTARSGLRPGELPRSVVVLLIAVSSVVIGLTVATPDPLVPLAVIGGAAAICLAVANPVAMIYVGILVIPLESQFHAVVGPSQAALGLAAVGWLARWAMSRPMMIPRHAAVGALIVWLVAAVAGWPWAPEPVAATRFVVHMATLVVVIVALAHSATEQQLMRLLFGFALLGGALGMVAIVDPQPLTAPVFGGANLSRATGGFGSPNALGMMLVMTMPIQIVFALRGTRVQRVVASGCVVLALVGMTLAVSRAAFVGLGAAVLLLALWRPFLRIAVLALPLVLVLALVGSNPASSAFNTGAVIDRLGGTDNTASTEPRFVLWRKAPAMIADRPIFGQGPLQYGHYMASYGILAQGPTSHAHAHNLVLNVTIETGLVGVLAMLATFAAVGVGLGRAIRQSVGLRQAMAFALAASLGGFFVDGVFDYALVGAIAAVFFVLVGCAVTLTLHASRERAQIPARPLVDGLGDAV